MSRTISFSANKTKVKPRPLVGTKTYVKQTERAMRDHEFSDSMMAMMTAMATPRGSK